MNKTINDVIIYKSDDGKSNITVRIENETVWLSQIQMAELFNTTKQNVSLHIQNIFRENELDKNSVVKDFLTTASDGKQGKISHEKAIKKAEEKYKKEVKMHKNSILDFEL